MLQSKSIDCLASKVLGDKVNKAFSEVEVHITTQTDNSKSVDELATNSFSSRTMRSFSRIEVNLSWLKILRTKRSSVSDFRKRNMWLTALLLVILISLKVYFIPDVTINWSQLTEVISLWQESGLLN